MTTRCRAGFGTPHHCDICGNNWAVNEVPPVCNRQPSHAPIERVNHPAHYGGEDNPYEAIKVIEAWQLGFCLGNTLKYISRAGLKPDTELLEDLKKAAWYINREIATLEKGK